MKKLITDRYAQKSVAADFLASPAQQAVTRFMAACFLLTDLVEDRPNPFIETTNIILQGHESLVPLSIKFKEAFDNLVRLYNSIDAAKANIIMPQLKTLLLIRQEVSEHPSIRLHTATYFSKKYNIGSSTLKRIFKKHFNLTLHGFVTTACMQKAQQLLEDKTLSIAYIAEELGYADRSGFLKTYKKFNEKMI